MAILVVVGRDLEEAISRGLERLGLNKDDAEWLVLYEGREKVKIKIFRKGEPQRIIKDVVEGFIQKFGAGGSAEVIKRDDGSFYVNIITKESDGVLIGKGGKNLEALQHLLARMVHRYDKTLEVVIDVSGYRSKKERILKSRALAFAEEVKRTGREVFFEPLPPSLRRVIHLALQGKDGVRTYTIGEGELKKVVIAPSRR